MEFIINKNRNYNLLDFLLRKILRNVKFQYEQKRSNYF